VNEVTRGRLAELTSARWRIGEGIGRVVLLVPKLGCHGVFLTAVECFEQVAIANIGNSDRHRTAQCKSIDNFRCLGARTAVLLERGTSAWSISYARRTKVTR
jgi:hypothetical protein